MTRRFPWRLLAVVVLFLTLLAPVIGACSTLFWSYAADGNDPQRVAGETYDRVMSFDYGARHSGYRSRRDRYLGPPSDPVGRRCESRFTNRSDDGAINLVSAVEHYRRHRLQDAFDAPGLRALAARPAPVLGALAACIDASLLVGLCAGHVVRISDEANLAEADSLREMRSVIEREVEQMWCAAGSN